MDNKKEFIESLVNQSKIPRRNIFIAITYLLYIVFWESMVLGGIGYAVFVLGKSPWWMLYAIILSFAAYSPKKWGEMYNGG